MQIITDPEAFEIAPAPFPPKPDPVNLFLSQPLSVTVLQIATVLLAALSKPLSRFALSFFFFC
ncbi:MAG: hypothetical protein JST84_05100 [Acidobacteria bacterium]|nr:hypothetical protein [Acidobacteriota bacterium]